MTFKQAFEFLESLQNISKSLKKENPKFAFQRTKYFFNLIGNPQNKIKNYIHITGTSGKGTCAYLIQHLLTKNGFKTGLYVSPHIYTPCERISINGKLISEKDFIKILSWLEPKITEMAYKSKYSAPSYFEVFFAIACKYFEKEKCDFVVCEVGMGGDWDATNIIPCPKIAILTNVGLEHSEFLGKNLKQIAKTKLGIVKNGSILITGENRKSILKFIKDYAKKRGAKKIIIIDNKEKLERNIRLKFIPEDNIKIALKVSSILNLKIINFTKIKIPGRFEIVSKKPYIILDGAHNSYKIRILDKNIKEFIKNYSIENLYIIFASHKGKDWKKMLRELIKLNPKELIITKTLILEKKSVDFREYYRFLNKIGFKNYRFFINPFSAFKYGKAKINKKDLLVITGSFFLIPLY